MAERLRIGLEFDESGDPIAGTLTVGEAQRPFTGWLGLIAALEAAIAGRDPVPPVTPGPGDHEVAPAKDRGGDHDDAGLPR